MECSKASLAYLLHHVFLPPKLPSSGDDNTVKGDSLLLDRLSKELQSFAEIDGKGNRKVIQSMSTMITNISTVINEHGNVNEGQLLKMMANLSSGGVLPVYIKAQNAGLIIRTSREAILFEAFELSPSNEAVMDTKGRLKRCFPRRAVEVDRQSFQETGFQSTLAGVIAKLSYQEAAEMKGTAWKAGQEHIETRETNSPDLVTEFLMSFLEAAGRPVSAAYIWKNTREEVVWSNTLLPWRRSPIWLLARVALQSTLFGLTASGVCYKEFMVFFMGRILNTAYETGAISSDLHCILCKISRRLLKLQPPASSGWYGALNQLTEKTVHLLSQRRAQLESAFNPGLELSGLQKLRFTDDCKAQFSELDAYIDLIGNLPDGGSRKTFLPAFITSHFKPNELPNLKCSTWQSDLYMLAAFEAWVPARLDAWASCRLPTSTKCESLSLVIERYHTLASKCYQSNPENVSIMLLTCLELWIACDNLTAREHTLLLEYNLNVPSELLQSLLLPLKSHMERLHNIEVYLKARLAKANNNRPYILGEFGAPDSFAARHYASSRNMQELRAEIEEAAEWAKQEKLLELKEKKAEHTRLMSLHDLAVCENVTVWSRQYRCEIEVHSGSCKKCSYRSQAEALKIGLHEWPLPSDEPKIRSTVFELDCPGTFSAWRNATVYILHDALHSSYQTCEAPQLTYTPESYLVCSVKKRIGRISLRSRTKPHVVTHRKEISISLATASDVCVKNGLNYCYLDNRAQCFVTPFKTTDYVPKACTYLLKPSCSSLQEFLYRPSFRSNGPTPNVVISKQSSCPNDMSLEEFKTLATMPLGTQLQWQNILVQLVSPSISFQRREANHVILQILLQAGPPSAASGPLPIFLRQGHQDPYDNAFGGQLLRGLQQGLERIQENWESYYALGSFIAIAARLSSLTPSDDIADQSLKYLQQCRMTAMKWIHLVRERGSATMNGDERTEFSSIAFEISHICASTFDVDDTHLARILATSQEAASFIECSITINETTHSASKDGGSDRKMRYQSWQRLSTRVLPTLINQIITEGSDCLDLAVGQSWSLYSRIGKWSIASADHTQWLAAKSKPASSLSSQTVHCNLLTGELLVDGLPLSRLPDSFAQHAQYVDLFGRACVEVMPSSMRGMKFSAMKPFKGYDVDFGLLKKAGFSTPELVLASFRNGNRCDLLPARLFRQKLPHHFVDNFVHWYYPSKAMIEFRPRNDPWSSPPSPHRLVQSNGEWVLNLGEDTSLISPRSCTGGLVAQVFSTVESPLYMHVAFTPLAGFIEISLPRLRLDFLLHPQTTRIMSRQYRGFYMDKDTRLGTLTGLKSKLVLRDDRGSRMVLIPDGIASWGSARGHVEVTLDQSTSTKAFPFSIDRALGRLLDNGDLESKLQRCYLHALTAHCRPDILTGKTGTEEALEILRSAAVKSFSHLSSRELAYLKRIAELTPRRNFYPKHQRLMQTVSWDPHLDSLSQHGGFYQLTKSLLDQGALLGFFQGGKLNNIQTLDCGDIFLLNRNSIRSATFRRSGFGAEEHTSKHDVEYKARLPFLAPDNQRSSAAYIAAKKTIRKTESTQSSVSDDLADHIWAFISPAQSISGASLTSQDCLIGYDAERLSDWRKFLAKNWCQIVHELKQESHRFDKFQKSLFIATIAFAKDVDAQVVQLLVSVNVSRSIGELPLPAVELFQLQRGHNVSTGMINRIVERNFKPFDESPESQLSRLPGEPTKKLQSRRLGEFRERQTKAKVIFVEALVDQWPCNTPLIPSTRGSSVYINQTPAVVNIKQLFQECWENHRLYLYLRQIGTLLQSLPLKPLKRTVMSIGGPRGTQTNLRPYISMVDLFLNVAPAFAPRKTDALTTLLEPVLDGGESKNTKSLKSVISQLESQASRSYQKTYIDDLRKSLSSLRKRKVGFRLSHNEEHNRNVLKKHLSVCKERTQQAYQQLVAALTMPLPVGNSIGAAERLCKYTFTMMYNSPPISPSLLLGQLSRQKSRSLPPAWKQAIVAYGVVMTELQHALRLWNCRENPQELTQELENTGHKNWSPVDYPESLLIEIESGLLIREVQEEIAAHMRGPPGGQNAVMQLHMGEGKSSIIVPIVAAALADGNRLVRVIVAKPQFMQMHQMLVSKLGGLLDRQVYHMPFSRSLRVGSVEAQTIKRTYNDCMSHGGILLVQPEQLLSFQLMGIEKTLSGQEEVARSLLSTQAHFNTCSRDIIDESDENFSVKFELVYTIGNQQPIVLSPKRWRIIQEVLGIVARVAVEVKEHLPRSIELLEGPRVSFPRIRVLDPDAYNDLQSNVVADICEYGLKGFPISRQPASVRDSVFKYITRAKLSANEITAVESCSEFWTDSTKQPLLLLRGLFAGGIFAFVFGQKRWRVNYGLDNLRDPKTLLAVPFRAKDSPTLRSEFSHPDVVIIMTCLSYYYGGLDDEQLFWSFEHLLKSDEPETDFSEWTRNLQTLPASFRQLVGINLKDRHQCVTRIFPHLRKSKTVVDYFLANIVFPKQMKEYAHKLSASGWDLGCVKPNPTTGFSGTNDSQHLLPLSVKYLNLPKQTHTNALVLQYILQPENTVQLISTAPADEDSDARHFLKTVDAMNPPVQVILDVGSLIIELGNIEAASAWLELTPAHKDKHAVVFFDDNDELSVLDRKGRVESLQTSPFARQLGSCLVYLDEAHTRGTDLKLPIDYRAAVTLGANLTKDRLVQACMRMRKLGKGQSVVFCISEEIQSKILTLTKKKDTSSICVADVLIWAMNETQTDLRRSMPMWATQGARFERQKLVWKAATNGSMVRLTSAKAKNFLEKEAMSLDTRYRPRKANLHDRIPGLNDSPERDAIIKRCVEFDSIQFASATLQEEQERELSPENEQERQVERPSPAKPLPHKLQPAVVAFVRSGTISEPLDLSAFIPAFLSLDETSVASHLDLKQFPKALLVTQDFARTVTPDGVSTGKTKHSADAFQRPVQWVLTSTAGGTEVKHMVIISPFEAHWLRPIIKSLKQVRLHAYAPRWNIAHQSLSDLTLYPVPSLSGRGDLPSLPDCWDEPGLPVSWSVPTELTILLNLFSGQLYFETFEEYTKVCSFLGLAWKETAPSIRVQADGFMTPHEGKSHGRFAQSPTRFLMVLFTKIRRNCGSISKTHLGRVLEGDRLRESEFTD